LPLSEARTTRLESAANFSYSGVIVRGDLAPLPPPIIRLRAFYAARRVLRVAPGARRVPALLSGSILYLI